MSCQQTMTLGVYLLGALDPGERSAFESHLSFCEICRGELVRLAPLPGLLNQITPGDFADNLPSTEVDLTGTPVTTRAQPVRVPMSVPAPRAEVPRFPVPDDPPAPRNRPPTMPKGRPGNAPLLRRFRRVAMAAAAVVVLAVGGIFGWQTLRHETVPPPEGVVWSATSPDGGTRVEARMIDHEWGTEIQTKLDGLPPGRKCYLMVWDHYGNREIAGWWGTDHDPNEEIPASTSIHRSKIDRLELMLDDRTVALTVEAPS